MAAGINAHPVAVNFVKRTNMHANIQSKKWFELFLYLAGMDEMEQKDEARDHGSS